MNAAKSDSLDRLVRVLSERGPMTAGQVGLELWWRDSMAVRPGNTIATMFCRPAGKLLRRAETAGIVRCRFDPYRRKATWYANAEAHGRRSRTVERRGPDMKSKRYIPFMERLTPEQLLRFRREMANLRRRFRRRMTRKQNAEALPRCEAT